MASDCVIMWTVKHSDTGGARYRWFHVPSFKHIVQGLISFLYAAQVLLKIGESTPRHTTTPQSLRQSVYAVNVVGYCLMIVCDRFSGMWTDLISPLTSTARIFWPSAWCYECLRQSVYDDLAHTSSATIVKSSRRLNPFRQTTTATATATANTIIWR